MSTVTNPQRQSDLWAFPGGGGNMAAQFARVDWTAHPLGPPVGWPQALHIAVRMVLASEQPMWLGWGRDLACFYNEACIPLLGTKHPAGAALGRPAEELWGELTEPALVAYREGRAARREGVLRVPTRDGNVEELCHIFSCSPLPDDHGGIGGALCIVTEQTSGRSGERRSAVAREPVVNLRSVETGAAPRDRDSLYRRLVEALPAAVYTCDAHGRIEIYNEAAVALWGRAPERGVDVWCGWLRIFRPDGTPMALDACPMAVTLRDGKAVEGEEIIVERPDGSRRHVLPHPRPLLNAEGKVVGAINMLVDITDVKHAEAERRDATSVLAGSIDALTSHIAILDASGVIIKVNEAWRRFAAANGYTERGFGLGMNYIEACEPRGASAGPCDIESEAAAQGLREVIAGERTSFVMEYPCHSPTEQRWFIMRVTRFGEGAGLRLVVSHDDVTERRIAEEAKQQHAERLRIATEATNLGTWDFDPLTGRLVWDERCRELFGLGAGAEVTYDVFLSGLHPDDRARVDAEVARALEAAAPRNFETEYRTVGLLDAVERWVRATGRSFVESGRVVRFIGTVQDVTERKRSEEALRRSEEMIRLATDAAGMGTWARDMRTNQVLWSAKLEQIVGMPRGGFRGHERDFFELVHPDDRERVRLVVEEAVVGRREYEVEFRYRHTSGEYRWMVGRGRAWFDEGGKPVMLAGTGQDVTDRKLAEGVLRESEARFRQMADSAPMMVWMVDHEGSCTFLSKSWYEFTGQTPSEALGTGWTNAIHPEDHGAAHRAFMEAVASRQALRIEYRLRRRDGEYRWAIDAAAPRFGADGQFLGYIGSVIDITERKEAEATLAASEEQFRTLADSIPQLAWITRPDGYITWYNKRWYEYTGTTFEQMEASGWQSVHDPADLPRVVAKFKAALASGEAWEDTFQLRRHDGEMRWHLSQARPVRDERERIVRWFGTNTDITAQREAEESLRASEERFRLMADAAPTLIWLADADKQRTWFNKPWLDFTGRSMADELGSGWVHGVHPEDMGSALGAYLGAFETQREFRMEYRLLRRDGAYRWMLAHGVPLHGAGGKFTGMIGVCIDITDQVQARQTLERQQVLLEEAVRARTEELQSSNERLRLAERMASLGTLSAGLGHDMGNLLVPLRVRLESLSKATLPPELREDVDAIRSSADYLQRLASGLRLLAIDPRRAAVGEGTDLAAWWAETGSLMKNAVPRGIEVACRMEAGACRAAVSRAALTQAVFNLVQNAGDAMRARGKGHITVWATAEGETVRVGVSDDGPGMSADIKARCMEPFFTTKTRGISTGMGLALVYGLVRDAGGSVDVESEIGRGTTFVLVFKRAVEQEKGGAGKRAVVLVDDLRQRALITAELRALEFSVSTGPADTEGADLVVAEDASCLPATAPGRTAVLLGDNPTERQGVVSLGARPRLQAIREALRRIANKGT
jgi:PAS domain S-box-containing protein